MQRLIAAAAALALITAPAAHAAVIVLSWTCTAVGLRDTGPVPAPQRVAFSGRGGSRTAAAARALQACKADHQVTPSSCQLGACRTSRLHP